MFVLYFVKATRHGEHVDKLIPQLEQYLKEGVLREEFLLDNIAKLMNVMRQANVTLRWIMLHTSAPSPSTNCSVLSQINHLCVSSKN